MKPINRLWIAFFAVALMGNHCSGPLIFVPNTDGLLFADYIDFATGLVAEIVAGAPLVRPGPDGNFGTADDVISPSIVGDADLVVRTGMTSFSGPFPPTPTPAGAPVAVAEPFGQGVPVSFVVGASSSAPANAPGPPTVPPSLEGVPVVVAAFGDLDGDGFIGITHLDGDLLDFGIEEAEFVPLGRTMAFAQGGQASGSLSLGAGGPSNAPLSVVVTAAAYAGPLDPAFFGGIVPDGPLMMTELPFLPRTDPDDLINAGPAGPSQPVVGGLLAVEIESAYDPDPADLRVGESFTIPVDGSAQTVSLAIGRTGQHSRFGLGQRPDPATFRSGGHRLLRPGLDDAGAVVVYEILNRLMLPDDGAGSPQTLRVLPLDRLGNVADMATNATVTISSGGIVRIVSPDTDGDPFAETVTLTDNRGVSILLDDGGLAFDDVNEDIIVVDDGLEPTLVEISLPDPDVDDSGLVDAADHALVSGLSGLRLGDPFFDPDADLSGDGRIDKLDADIVNNLLGLSIPVP